MEVVPLGVREQPGVRRNLQRVHDANREADGDDRGEQAAEPNGLACRARVRLPNAPGRQLPSSRTCTGHPVFPPCRDTRDRQDCRSGGGPSTGAATVRGLLEECLEPGELLDLAVVVRRTDR